MRDLPAAVSIEGKGGAPGDPGSLVPGALPEPDRILAGFLERIEMLKRDAAAWGLQPHWPEAVYLSSMTSTQIGFAEMVVLLTRRIEGVVTETRAVAEAELARQRAVTDGTQRAMDTARAVTENLRIGSKIALAGFEAEKQKVTTDFVKNLIPEIVIGLQKAMVLRQYHYNRDKEWGRAMGIGGVMLALLVGGYVWGSFGDNGRAIRIEHLDAAIERCQATSKWRDEKGDRLCAVNDLKRF